MNEYRDQIINACGISGITGFEVYEDNGGGIHLFAMVGETPVIMFSGLEFAGEDALSKGEDFSNWVFDVPDDDYSKIYEEIREMDDLIADTDGIYPDRMGFAGKTAFGIRDEEDE